jgi:hypothetical protein
MVDRGNTVLFTKEGGYIQSASGEKLPLRRTNGTFVMDIAEAKWVFSRPM